MRLFVQVACITSYFVHGLLVLRVGIADWLVVMLTNTTHANRHA